jgi:hypothetical protein
MNILVIGVLVLIVLYIYLVRRREHLFVGWCKYIGLPEGFCYFVDPCLYIPKMSYTQWIRDWICGQGGCPEGKVKEAGLCYDACKDGFGSDGALMCWKRYPEFPGAGGGYLNTPTLTKQSKTVTGSGVSECRGDKPDKDAGLCYKRCRDGMKGVGPVCWQDIYGVGIGKVMS